MHRPGTLDPELIFPIRDEASARLMRLKADCLYRARVITAAERKRVHDKAAAVTELKRAA